MTVAQTPDLLSKDVDDLAYRGPDVKRAYRRLYEACYEKRRGGHPGSGGDAIVNDVAGLLGSKAGMLEKLTTASGDVKRAAALMRGAQGILDEIAELINAGADRTLPPTDERLYPRTVSKDERAESQLVLECSEARERFDDAARRVKRAEVDLAKAEAQLLAARKARRRPRRPTQGSADAAARRERRVADLRAIAGGGS